MTQKTFQPPGVCIRFDKQKLLACFEKKPGTRFGPLRYYTIDEIVQTPPPLKNYPFIKRKPYEDEAEFRIVFEHKSRKLSPKKYALDLSSISRIALGPWNTAPMASTVKDLIQDLPGCEKIRLIRTGVLDSIAWKRAVRNTLAEPLPAD